MPVHWSIVGREDASGYMLMGQGQWEIYPEVLKKLYYEELVRNAPVYYTY